MKKKTTKEISERLSADSSSLSAMAYFIAGYTTKESGLSLIEGLTALIESLTKDSSTDARKKRPRKT